MDKRREANERFGLYLNDKTLIQWNTELFEKKSIDFHSLKQQILLQVTLSCKWLFQFNKIDN